MSIMRASLIRVVLVLAAMFVVAVPGSPLRFAPASRVQAAFVPTGLPSHFGVGLSGALDDTGLTGWMPNSGIPWDYAYQYLDGGVTGGGWETWGAGSGQFALEYAQTAASHHYIPFFSYYELLQSSCDSDSCDEARLDISGLNKPSLNGCLLPELRAADEAAWIRYLRRHCRASATQLSSR